MIKINLLPVRQIIKRRETKKQVFIFFVAVCVVLVGIGITSLGIARKISNLQKDVKQLQRKKASYQPLLDEIAKLKRDKQNVERKLGVIEGLKKGRSTTVKILDEVAKRTPVDRLWLKSFNQGKGSLRVSGIALDNATIADYMKLLSASPMLGDAELSAASQTGFAGKKLKSFSLTLAVIEPVKKTSAPGNTTRK